MPATAVMAPQCATSNAVVVNAAAAAAIAGVEPAADGCLPLPAAQPPLDSCRRFGWVASPHTILDPLSCLYPYFFADVRILSIDARGDVHCEKEARKLKKPPGSN